MGRNPMPLWRPPLLTVTVWIGFWDKTRKPKIFTTKPYPTHCFFASRILNMMALKRYVLANLRLVLVSVIVEFQWISWVPILTTEMLWSELWCLLQLREKEIDSTPHIGQTWSPHLLHILKHMPIPVWRHIIFSKCATCGNQVLFICSMKPWNQSTNIIVSSSHLKKYQSSRSGSFPHDSGYKC